MTRAQRPTDDELGVPPICVCPVARPAPGWGHGCNNCGRPVIHLWPPNLWQRAIRAYPELVDQQVDWTLRLEARR